MTVSPARLRFLLRVVRLAAMPLAILSVTLPACFDQSTYQGGGRRDIGGQLVPIDGGEEDLDAGLEEDVVVTVPDAAPETSTVPDTGAPG